jgi:cell division septum initiation protein DivIVA
LEKINIRETFRQVTLVSRFAPVLEKVIGDFSGEIKLAGLLDGSMMPRLETMAGGGNLITSAIEVANVNTLNQLSSSLKMDQLNNLKVNGAKIFVAFKEGVMDVKPFDFKALGIDMNLEGQTALNQQIGYILKMKIPRSMMGGAANGVMDDLLAKASKAGADIKPGDFINVDALIDGTLTDPKVRLNLAGTGTDLMESVKEQVQQQVEEKVEELKEDAKAEAEKILQEADRQAQALLDQAQKQSAEVLKNAQALADEAKKQAGTNADKIIKEAKGKGMIAEAAAKKSAEEVRKQGERQADNIMAEARKQSDSILKKAGEEADKIKSDAQQKIK